VQRQRVQRGNARSPEDEQKDNERFVHESYQWSAVSSQRKAVSDYVQPSAASAKRYALDALGE
jgi:hypothetical protein